MSEAIRLRIPEIPETDRYNLENSLNVYTNILPYLIPEKDKSGNPEVLNFFENTKILSIKNLIFETRFDKFIENSALIPESNVINDGMDRFISRSFEPARLISDRDQVFLQAAEPSAYGHKGGFRSSTGLSVTLDASVLGLTLDGRRVASEGEVARVDFTPGRRTSFDPRRMTDSLANGIEGIRQFVRAIDEGQLDEVETLVGNTNINMALIAQRLGFVIVDQDRTLSGEIDMTKGSFTVVARIQDVRERVKHFEESGAATRIQDRHARQSARSH